MSNRVLKKLQSEKDTVSRGIDGMSESDDGSSPQATGAVRKQMACNRFELLNSIEHSLSDTEAKEDDDREIELPQEGQERNKLEKQDSTHSTDSLKRKKKKKKKKLKSQKSTEEHLGYDEVDASLQEVIKILGEPQTSSEPFLQASSSSKSSHEKSILAIDLRNFNAENEMRKMFGSKIIHTEQAKRKGRGRGHGRCTVLVSPKNWPHIANPGLSMSLLETKNNISYFAFEHSKQYQQVQHQFLDAVESYNPDNIMALLNAYPSHVDALIQFSDICRMGEDAQMAAELIERALYCMECCMHPLFNLAQGNCRLTYRRAENRSFYISIFKHLTFVGQRGCLRTALEFCKLLLSLDPEDDPLGVLLVIDFYAIRSGQYEFLVRLYKEWNAARNLSQLPNFAFSAALAVYLMGVDETRGDKEADSMLQDALIMFPGLLMPLLNMCNVQPDAEVQNHPFFTTQAVANDPQALSQLQTLYVARCQVLWKMSDTMYWLERNVQKVLCRIKANDPYIDECEQKRKVRYKGMPSNILRHIILSNIKEATVTLPQDLRNNPIFSFDPIPPKDSISSYSRPQRPTSSENSGMLSVFVQSLLPNFNPRREESASANREGGGADRTEMNDLRRSVTSLLDAIRDLLSNSHLADAPNEGDVDSDEDRG